MRRSYLLVMTAALIAACNNEADMAEASLTPPERGDAPAADAIVFDVTDGTGSTRANGEIATADVLKTGLYASRGFGVFACYTGKLKYESTSVSPDFMHNQQVVYKGSAWTYDPVKYWSNNSTDHVSFFAYAPYEANPQDDGRCIIDMSKRDDQGDPWLNYRLAADPWSTTQPQVDLLYGVNEATGSPWLDQQRSGYGSGAKLAFSFRHALACIGDKMTITMTSELNALVTSNNYDVTISQVKIDYKNLTTKARLVLRSEGSANWKEIISGELTTTRTYTKDVSITFPKDGGTDNTTAKLISEGDGLFYIPLQVKGTEAACADVTISYTVYDGSETRNGTATTRFLLDMNLEATKQGIALQLTKDLDLLHP